MDPQNKLSLKDYLQLYSAFSPEQTAQTAVNLERLRSIPEDRAEKAQQRSVVNDLRREQQVDRRSRSLLEGVQAGGLDPSMAPYAKEALKQYYRLLGINVPEEQTTNPVTERLLKQRK